MVELLGIDASLANAKQWADFSLNVIPALQQHFFLSKSSLAIASKATPIYFLLLILSKKDVSSTAFNDAVIKNTTSFFFTLWFLLLTILLLFKFYSGAYLEQLSLEEQSIFFIGCIMIVIVKTHFLVKLFDGVFGGLFENIKRGCMVIISLVKRKKKSEPIPPSDSPPPNP